jgi:hypothetical protein
VKKNGPIIVCRFEFSQKSVIVFLIKRSTHRLAQNEMTPVKQGFRFGDKMTVDGPLLLIV